MKGFSSLTTAEILALTEQQIAYYTDLACAEDGAPLLPPDPGPAPIAPDADKDATVYEVEGLNFATSDDAARVAAILSEVNRIELGYAPGGSYSDRVAQPKGDEIAVRTVRAFSQAGWDRARAQVTAYNSAKESWDRAVSEFHKACETRAKVSGWIAERVQKERDREAQRLLFEADFARYIELAEGNRLMAYRFLIKAKPEAAELIPCPDMELAQ